MKVPIEIKIVEALKVAYIIFDNTFESKRFSKTLSGVISINSKDYRLEYAPTSNNIKVDSSQNYSKRHHKDPNSKVIVHEDWICEFVRIFLNLVLMYKFFKKRFVL